MEAMRESWTDDRLDDFRGEMSEFRRETKDEFKAVRAELEAVRKEMRDEFREVRQEMKNESASLREAVEALQNEVSLRLFSIQRIMIQFCGLMVAALIGLIATQA